MLAEIARSEEGFRGPIIVCRCPSPVFKVSTHYAADMPNFAVTYKAVEGQTNAQVLERGLLPGIWMRHRRATAGRYGALRIRPQSDSGAATVMTLNWLSWSQSVRLFCAFWTSPSHSSLFPAAGRFMGMLITPPPAPELDNLRLS